MPPVQLPVPRDDKPSLRVTVALLSQDIVKSGVVSEVMSSVDEVPESVPAVRSGVLGALGAVVSITIALLAARLVTGTKLVMALPEVSAIVPAIEDTSRSEVVSPACTV